MVNGYSLVMQQNKFKIMKLFKHPRTGLITIWCDHNIYEQYMFYSKREAMKMFKKTHGLKGKITEVNWCLWAF